MGARRDLRLSTIAALKAGQFVPEKHFFDTLETPLERNELPAIAVSTLTSSEEGQDPFMTDLDFTASVDLTIEVAMDGKSDGQLISDLDDKCDAVKEWLLSDSAWLRPIQGIKSVVTTIQTNALTDKRTAIGTIKMDVTVRAIYQPRVPDDLKSVRIKVDVIDPIADPNLHYPGPDGRIEAELRIENLSPED